MQDYSDRRVLAAAFPDKISRRITAIARTTRLLIVDPDAVFLAGLAAIVEWSAEVDAAAGFEAARTLLMANRYDLLVANVRLEAYNGLHLVYLAAIGDLGPRSVIYDVGTRLAREAQRAGAFFELAERIAISLSSYVGAPLPAIDRRNPESADRRSRSRGGRRAWDSHLARAVSPA